MSQPHPSWWDWELELSPHLLRRMIDRRFTEIDLRTMMEDSRSVLPDESHGRFVVESVHERRIWHIILEPDVVARPLVVVTAYPVE